MFCTIQQTSDGLRFLHRSYMTTKQNGGLLLREKQARRLSTRLNNRLTAQRRSHKLLEPSNHWTKNLKSLKNMACCRLIPGSNNSETAVYGEAEYRNATIIAKQPSMATILLCFELFQCRVDVAKLMFTWHDRYCCILLVEFKMSTCYLCWSGLYRSYFLQHVRLGSVAVLCG